MIQPGNSTHTAISLLKTQLSAAGLGNAEAEKVVISLPADITFDRLIAISDIAQELSSVLPTNDELSKFLSFLSSHATDEQLKRLSATKHNIPAFNNESELLEGLLYSSRNNPLVDTAVTSATATTALIEALNPKL